MNATSFKEKFLPYQQKLYRIAYRLLENGNDAEDMVQETYIKLWNKKEDLNLVDNVESYSIIILRNLCFDFIKKRNRQREDSLETIEHHFTDDNLILEQLDTKERFEIIDNIIKRLPDQQKMVMKLRHIDDCTSEEIELATGLSSVNVRVLLSRARKKVKEVFDKQYNNG